MKLRVNNLTKIYKNKNREVIAVDNLSFTTSDEILGILGPNGAGKSTLLSCIMTLLKPTAGTILVGDHSCEKEPLKVRHSISMSFQEPAFDMRLSLEKNLYFHARMCNLTREKARTLIEQFIKEFELSAASDRYPHQLSGGMKRKADLIRTLMRDTPMYIFDEPTAMLDPPSRKLVWGKITGLQEQGKTILLATNDMTEAETIADRVLILSQGRKKALDSISGLKKLVVEKETIDLGTNASVSDLERIFVDLNLEARVVTKKENRYTIFLDHAEKVLPRLLNEIYSRGSRVTTVNILPLSLDDIFFSLAGKTLDASERRLQE